MNKLDGWTFDPVKKKELEYHACNCIGPQKGQPVCPCRMGNIEMRNNRYVEVVDVGPVTLSKCCTYCGPDL